MKIIAPLFGPIGDALMDIALFGEILEVDPEATFLIITRHNAGLIRDLARAYPQIEVRQIPTGFPALTFFLKLLRERRTLAAFGVAERYSFRLKLFFFLFGLMGNRTVGLGDLSSNAGEGWLPLQKILPLHPDMPIFKQHRALLPYLGFSADQLARIEDKSPHVTLHTSLPDGFPFKKGAYIVIHPFGTSMWRTFPSRRWKSLLSAISRAHPELPLVITGASKDREQAEDIAGAVSNAHVYVNLPILDVAGIIDGAAFYMGVDTGITHLAGVLEQKSIIISHCGDRRWHPLYNPNARVLANSRRCTCQTGVSCIAEENGHMCYRCLYDITDEAVLSAVDLALSSKSRSVPGFGGWADENVTQHG